LENGTFAVSAAYSGCSIGGGLAYDNGKCLIGTMEIFDGRFNFTSIGSAPSIGSGSARNIDGIAGEKGGIAMVEALIVHGGSFCCNGNYGAGIGAGSAFGEKTASLVQTLVIVGGQFDIASDFAAGIGGGYATMGGNASVGAIFIGAGDFKIYADASGIGAGHTSTQSTTGVGRLELAGGTVVFSQASPAVGGVDALVLGTSVLECAPVISECVAGQTVLVNGSLQVFTSTARVFDSVVPSAVTAAEGAELFFSYAAQSAPEWIQLSALHFGGVAGLAGDGVYTLNFIGEGGSRTVQFAPATAAGLLVSLPAPGQYSVAFKGVDGVDGSLCNGTDPVFVVGVGDTFVMQAEVCASPPPTSIPPNVGLIAGLSTVGAVVLLCVVVVALHLYKNPVCTLRAPPSAVLSVLLDDR
jgi:hypothetical protein